MILVVNSGVVSIFIYLREYGLESRNNNHVF